MIPEGLTEIMGAIRALHSLALTGALLGPDGGIDYNLIKRIASPLTGGTCDSQGIPTLPENFLLLVPSLPLSSPSVSRLLSRLL
jgi:hypothetical protein